MPRRQKTDTARQVALLRSRFASLLSPAEVDAAFYSSGCDESAVEQAAAKKLHEINMDSTAHHPSAPVTKPLEVARPAAVPHAEQWLQTQDAGLSSAELVEAMFPEADHGEVVAALSRGTSVNDLVDSLLSRDDAHVPAELEHAYHRGACVDLMHSVFPLLAVATIKHVLEACEWGLNVAALLLADVTEPQAADSNDEAVHEEQRAMARELSYLQQLHELFPALSDRALLDTIHECGNDLAAAVDRLLRSHEDSAPEAEDGTLFAIIVICPHTAAVTVLSAMFPFFTSDALAVVLTLCGGDADMAREMLLSTDDIDELVLQLSAQSEAGQHVSAAAALDKGRRRHQKPAPISVSLAPASVWAAPDSTTVAPLASKLHDRSAEELYREFPHLARDVVQDVLLATNGDTQQARRSLTAVSEGVAIVAAAMQTAKPSRPAVPFDMPPAKSRTVVPQQGELYAAARSDAAHHALQRNFLFREAARAFASGHGPLARDLASRGQWHNQQMHEAHARSAELIFSERNAHLPPHTIDLHGLHVDEAITILARRIHQARQDGLRRLVVITGAGRHSAGGIARIKRAATAFLKAARIAFRIPRDQDGALTVLL